MSAQQALAQVNRLADQQAFTMAADDIFWISALMFLALVPLVWLMRLPHRQPAAGARADAAAGAH